jgi:hypothetical protein
LAAADQSKLSSRLLAVWISAESQIEWKNGRAYLLEPDGSAVEGILFVGEVATE